jgi:hypothetical protein
VPSSHDEHDDAPLLEKVPASHELQASLAALLLLPASQAEHEAEPALA